MSVEIVVGDDGGNLLSLGDAEQKKNNIKKENEKNFTAKTGKK